MTRARLQRSVAGAISTMLLCAATIFSAAHHLAG
jgi:hypothetical protein